MILKVINSNSAGNAYILESDREALLIECGVAFPKIKQALGFNLSKVVGCIISHEHNDHCKAVHEVMKAGIDVYTAMGTHAAMKTLESHRAICLEPGKPAKIGVFKVLPFDVKHDCANPFGFLIHHPECGTVLFLTDSYYSEYTFPGLNNVIIEANYCNKIIDAKMDDGETKKFLRDRIYKSHMNLQTCKQLLGANDLKDVINIVLIHLSDSHSDEKRFQKEVQEQTGKQVFVARPGLSIPFNADPF